MSEFAKPTRRIFSLLMVFLLVISLLPLVAVVSEPVQAQVPNLDIKFERIAESPISAEFRITIQNFENVKRSLPLTVFLENLTFPIEDLNNIRMFVWDNDRFLENVPIYDNVAENFLIENVLRYENVVSLENENYQVFVGDWNENNFSVFNVNWENFDLYGNVENVGAGYEDLIEIDNQTYLIEFTRYGLVGYKEENVWRFVKHTLKEWFFKGKKENMVADITIPSYEVDEGWGFGTKVFEVKINTGLKNHPEGGWGSAGVMSWNVDDVIYRDLSGSSWWDSNWGYKKVNPVNGSTAGAQTNYQVRMRVHAGTGTDTPTDVFLGDHGSFDDFRDVRWVQTDSVECDFWIESFVSGDYADFWVEVPSIPSDPNTVNVSIYYGNSGATSVSSGDDTFEFFDDFPGDSLDTDKWGTTSGTITVSGGWCEMITGSITTVVTFPSTTHLKIEARINVIAHATGYGYWNMGTTILNTAEDTNFLRMANYSYTGNQFTLYFDGGYHWYSGPNPVNGMVRLVTYFDDDEVGIELSGAQTGSASAPHTTSLQQYKLNLLGPTYPAGREMEVDWIFARKYADPEPTWGTWGGEEEPPVGEWLSGWGRRKKQTITGSTAGVQTNYQLNMVVHKGSGTDTTTDVFCGGNCRDDFGDIRWTQSDGITTMDYWIETLVSGDYAEFWVEIPSIPTDVGTVDAYLYYDNPEATSLSNGDATFLLYEDFTEGLAEFNNRWTLHNSINYSIEDEKLKVTDAVGGTAQTRLWKNWFERPLSESIESSEGLKLWAHLKWLNAKADMNTEMFGICSSPTEMIYEVGEADDHTANYSEDGKWADTGGVNEGLVQAWAKGDYEADFELIKDQDGNVRLRAKGRDEADWGEVLKTTAETITHVSMNYSRYSTYPYGTSWLDYIIARKYASPEPTWGSWGDEETPPIKGKPVLISPENNAMIYDTTPTFEWTKGENADNHNLLVDDDSDFSSPAENVWLGPDNESYTLTDELAFDDYWWKVVATQGCPVENENASDVWTFKLRFLHSVAWTVSSQTEWGDARASSSQVTTSGGVLQLAQYANWSGWGVTWSDSTAYWTGSTSLVTVTTVGSCSGSKWKWTTQIHVVDGAPAGTRTTVMLGGVGFFTESTTWDSRTHEDISNPSGKPIQLKTSDSSWAAWTRYNKIYEKHITGYSYYNSGTWTSVWHDWSAQADVDNIQMSISSVGGGLQVKVQSSDDGSAVKDDSGWLPVTSTGSVTKTTSGVSGRYVRVLFDLTKGSTPQVDDFTVNATLPISTPTVTTQAATDVEATTARLNGQISDDGGEACQYRFRYKKSGGDYSYTTWTGAKTTGQTFYEDISELDSGSLYYFNAQAKNPAGESDWGGELSFTTSVVGAWSVVGTWTGTTEAPAEYSTIQTWTGTVEALAQYSTIEKWSGTVNAPTIWSGVETWQATVKAMAVWSSVGMWTGTVCAPSIWASIEAWIGTIGAPAQYTMVETWSGIVKTVAGWWEIGKWQGTVLAPSQWQAIGVWMGTVQAPALWATVETWSGNVASLAAVWGTIETWTGTVKAPAQYQLIETWTGTIQAPALWGEITVWSGTVKTTAGWWEMVAWSGTVSAPATWASIETWIGNVSAPAEWQSIEIWAGTVKAHAATWSAVDLWIGTVEAPSYWGTVETWDGTVGAPSAWGTIEAWTGTVVTTAGWGSVATWSGTVTTSAIWGQISEWSGTVIAPSVWNFIEAWSGNIITPVAWAQIETWSGTVIAPSVWGSIEAWVGTVEAPAQYGTVAEWSGTVFAPAQYSSVETWSGTVVTSAVWGQITEWTGTVSAPSAWGTIEAWAGTVGTSAVWGTIEMWTGTVEAPAAWSSIETWSSAVLTQANWNAIATWEDSVVAATAEWDIVEMWVGQVLAQAQWNKIAMWGDTLVTAPAEWGEVETWIAVVSWRGVRTDPATNIGINSATLNATIGSSVLVDARFQYRKHGEADWIPTPWRAEYGTYSYRMTWLSSGTKFKFRAHMAHDGRDYFGSVRTFTTESVVPPVYPYPTRPPVRWEYDVAMNIAPEIFVSGDAVNLYIYVFQITGAGRRDILIHWWIIGPDDKSYVDASETRSVSAATVDKVFDTDGWPTGEYVAHAGVEWPGGTAESEQRFTIRELGLLDKLSRELGKLPPLAWAGLVALLFAGLVLKNEYSIRRNGR